MALSLANLAALMQVQGKYGEAEELLRRALSIREDALGPDHPMVREHSSNLQAPRTLLIYPHLWADGDGKYPGVCMHHAPASGGVCQALLAGRSIAV